MLKGFTTVLIKELKELMRDPKILVGMIVVPLVLFPVLGLVMGYAVSTAQEQAQKATLLVVNNDGEEWSTSFIDYLNTYMNVAVINNTSSQEIIEQNLLPNYNSTQFVEIPAGFSANMTQHLNGDYNITTKVNIYGVFQGGGIFSDLGSSGITVLIDSFNRAIAPDVVAPVQSTIIKGQVQEGVDPATLSGLMMSQSIALPRKTPSR